MIHHFTSDEYRWLSNFYPCEIEYEGEIYRSTEHAYMSAKSNDPEWKQFCIDTEDAATVKRKSYEIEYREGWDDIKISVMNECIKKKFSQEPFRSKLLDTGTQYIQEGNWWNDRFWGVDLKVEPPVGKNILGKLIMEYRSTMVLNDIL